MYSGFNSAKEITKGKVANPAFDGMCISSTMVSRLTMADKHVISEYAKSTGAFKVVVLASPALIRELSQSKSGTSLWWLPIYPIRGWLAGVSRTKVGR